MRTVQSAELQATQMRMWYHYCPSSFLAVLTMSMLASLSSFSYLRSRIAAAAVDANGKLSPTYARYVLYDMSKKHFKIGASSAHVRKGNLSCHGLFLLALTLAMEVGEATSKRDLSNITYQFNLHKHLMSPTKKDLRDGVENSRRLARNAIKLDIDTDMHRKVRDLVMIVPILIVMCHSFSQPILYLKARW